MSLSVIEPLSRGMAGQGYNEAFVMITLKSTNY